MINILSENLIRLAKSCPYPIYVVGGRVRDFLAGLNTEKPDTDICAPADTDDFIKRAEAAGFTVNAEYKHTGTVKLTCEGEDYEFTSFRSDEYVRGEHKPTATYFTEDINLDARRRDFKCNAVYYDIAAAETVDPLGGVDDIKNRRISTVASAEKVFGEDGLRLMRLARIAAQTGFTPTKTCMRGARVNAALIKDISAERVYAELNSILQADKRYGMPLAQYMGLKILKDTGVLAYILPELAEGESMRQRKDFHKYDVLEHSLRAAAYADVSVRFAALLHDIGKPYCFNTSGRFVDHEEEGARIAAEVCERLKAPKKLAEETVRLIGLHMYDFDCRAKENKIRKFIIRNLDILPKLLLLKQADFSACRDDFSTAPSVAKFNAVYEKMKKEGVPFTLKELNIRGDELISAGFAPESVGATLTSLLEDAAINLVPNEREKLLVRAIKVYPSGTAAN